MIYKIILNLEKMVIYLLNYITNMLLKYVIIIKYSTLLICKFNKDIKSSMSGS